MDVNNQVARLEPEERVDKYAEVFERASVGISRQSFDGTFLEMNPAAAEIYGVPASDLIGKPFWVNFHPDHIEPAREWLHALASGHEEQCTLDNEIIRPDGSIVCVRTNVSRGEYCLIVMVEDITDQKHNDVQTKLLLDELNHRVKNTLATVQSISMQTMRSVENDPVEFRKRFQTRLLSLSKAHDLLTHRGWDGAELGEIIALTLNPYITSDGASIDLHGDAVHLNPNAAVTLNMVFHELATNAAKYGSLSSPTGRLEVTWHYDRPRKPTGVHITWKESDGPLCQQPKRTGFGTRMILSGPQTELWAKTGLDYKDTGLECTLDVPFTQKVSVPTKKRVITTRNRRPRQPH
jgi:PAS domain S-box-containing protein